MLLPHVDEVRLQGARDGTEIVESSDTSVDLERGDDEHLAEKHVVEGGLVEVSPQVPASSPPPPASPSAPEEPSQLQRG